MIGFSSVSIDAYASDRTVIYTQIQRSAGIDIFGSQIPYNVTQNGVTTSGYFVLTENIVTDSTQFNCDQNSVLNSSNQVMQYEWLIYTANAGANNSQDYCDFVLDIPVTFSDSARGIFAMSFTGLLNNGRETSSDNAIALYPNNYFNSIHAISQNTQASASLADYYGYFRLNYASQGVSDTYVVRSILYDFSGGQTISSVYFQHVRPGISGDFMFAIGLPYVYGTLENSSSVTTSAVTGSDINVNVDVDLTETNTILGTISSLLSGLIDGIKGLFVPDQEWLVSWINSVKSTLTEFFTFYPAANSMVEQAFDTILEGSAVESIYFPAIELPDITGQYDSITLYSGGYVPLLPQSVNFTVTEGVLGSATFFDYMKYLIDIVATMYVINMVRNKFKAVLVGESVVELDDGGGE